MDILFSYLATVVTLVLIGVAWFYIDKAIGDRVEAIKMQIDDFQRVTEDKLAQIKLQTEPRISIPPGTKKIAAVRQAPTVHDYEASQRAVLDEFKES
jgi:hypothetical protein